jgi:FKBP-type peptidyl-prolyl cis-trans isomerase
MIRLALISGCFCGLIACSSQKTEKPIPEWNQQKSTDLNRELMTEQEIDIKLFLAQHEAWKVEETGTGLRYVVGKETDGPIPQPGQSAKVQYKISLLNGKVCYETAPDELDVFVVDNSEMESGIHEGIKKMRLGEKAKLIFPSHLAHGLVGDMKEIPPLSPLVVDIELITIE